jgi:uncharacterized membrane protein YraQ (UPF0718 family)
MNEKHLSAFGAGLILISFGVIVSFFVATGVESKAAEENQTISFKQLGELPQSSHEKLKNNPVSQEFRKFVGNTIEELKEKVILTNSTLHSVLKNSTEINETD